MGDQGHTLFALPQWKRTCTHCTGGCVGSRTFLTGCQKPCFHRDSIQDFQAQTDYSTPAHIEWLARVVLPVTFKTRFLLRTVTFTTSPSYLKLNNLYTWYNNQHCKSKASKQITWREETTCTWPWTGMHDSKHILVVEIFRNSHGLRENMEEGSVL